MKKTDEELAKIEEIHQEIKKKQRDQVFPNWWVKGDTLRYLCTNEGDVTKAAIQMKTHFDFIKSLKSFKLSDEAAQHIINGNVFIGGRDISGYPTLILRLNNLKINKNCAESIKDAMIFCLLVLKKYMMVPHYSEKFNFFMDIADKGILNISPTLLKSFSSLMADNHNGL